MHTLDAESDDFTITPDGGAIMGPNDGIIANESAAENHTVDASPRDDTTYDSNADQTSPEHPIAASLPISREDAKFYLGDLHSLCQPGLVAFLHSLGQSVNVTDSTSRMELFGLPYPCYLLQTE